MSAISPTLLGTLDPPVMEAFGWLEGVDFPPDRPLISLSQAAPNLPPPLELRQALADAALNNDDAHFYGPVLGLPELRQEIAAQWSQIYGGDISVDDVAVTAGCNQAFCTAVTTVASAGDQVILPTPWYFNHKMWLDMANICTVPISVGANMLPQPDEAAKHITSKTRAIVLVTPNNPTGAEYPAALLEEFAELCRANNIALIIDETYRDFLSHDQRPHDLFRDPKWRGTLFHLYSFSKIYRLTGHRVGVMIADRRQIEQAEKVLDTVTICPNQLGQIGALFGLTSLKDWARNQTMNIRKRRIAVGKAFAAQSRFRLLSAGAYFAYFEHDTSGGSDALAKEMIHKAGLLMMPGRMFVPENCTKADSQMRMAFANVDETGLSEVFSRLSQLR